MAVEDATFLEVLDFGSSFIRIVNQGPVLEGNILLDVNFVGC